MCVSHLPLFVAASLFTFCKIFHLFSFTLIVCTLKYLLTALSLLGHEPLKYFTTQFNTMRTMHIMLVMRSN